MKKTIFINGFIFMILFFCAILLFLLYLSLKDSFELGLLLFVVMLGMLFYNAIWFKIIIDLKKVTLINGFIRHKIDFNEFVSLKMGYFQPKFVRGAIPAIIIKTKKDIEVPLYFRRYKERDIVELVNRIKEANNETLLCRNIKMLINGRESVLVKAYKRDANMQVAIIFGSLIVTGIIFMLVKR